MPHKSYNPFTFPWLRNFFKLKNLVGLYSDKCYIRVFHTEKRKECFGKAGSAVQSYEEYYGILNSSCSSNLDLLNQGLPYLFELLSLFRINGTTASLGIFFLREKKKEWIYYIFIYSVTFLAYGYIKGKYSYITKQNSKKNEFHKQTLTLGIYSIDALVAIRKSDGLPL